MKNATADAVAAHNATVPKEEQWQKTLIEWCRTEKNRRPGLEDIYHVPNYRWLGGAKGAKHAQMNRLRAIGYLDGVSDLLLDLPSGNWSGARLELKRRGEKPTAAQVAYLARSRGNGFAVVVVDNFEDARAWLEHYWDDPRSLEAAFPHADDYRLRKTLEARASASRGRRRRPVSETRGRTDD